MVTSSAMSMRKYIVKYTNPEHCFRRDINRVIYTHLKHSLSSLQNPSQGLSA